MVPQIVHILRPILVESSAWDITVLRSGNDRQLLERRPMITGGRRRRRDTDNGSRTGGDRTTGSGSYMYETGSSNVLSTEILSTEIDLSAFTAPELLFWYHMFGGLIDELEVFVEQGGNSSSIALISGAQQTGQADPWLEQIVDLSAFSGSTIKLRFVGNRNPGFNNQVDISIDDISIDEPPACPAPTALATANATTTSIDISWTSGGAANWQIEYGPVGFAVSGPAQAETEP